MKADDLAFLAALLQEQCGQVLRTDNSYFVESRLAALARRETLDSVDALVTRLRGADAPALAVAAAEALTVTDTAFFRDGATFEALRALLPELAAGAPDRRLRVWSAGCSTGQEPFSIAMLADEHSPPLRLEIVATDVSERVLEKAHSGLYTQFEVQRGLPIRLLLKHFEKSGEMWAISPRLRGEVRWRRLNLVGDRRSVKTFDLILCRNVLSQMTAEGRGRALAQLLPALGPHGLLVLGAGEAAPTGFSPVGENIFRLDAGQARAAA